MNVNSQGFELSDWVVGHVVIFICL